MKHHFIQYGIVNEYRKSVQHYPKRTHCLQNKQMSEIRSFVHYTTIIAWLEWNGMECMQYCANKKYIKMMPFLGSTWEFTSIYCTYWFPLLCQTYTKLKYVIQRCSKGSKVIKRQEVVKERNAIEMVQSWFEEMVVNEF